MSHSQPVAPGDSPATLPVPPAVPANSPAARLAQAVVPGDSIATRQADPCMNPSYPQRAHILEKPHWQSVLQNVESRLVVPRQKLQVLGNDPKRPAFERIFAQMLGARDQVADAVRRLPQETGDLYEEDHHRVEEAVAALDRLAVRWDTLTTAR